MFARVCGRVCVWGKKYARSLLCSNKQTGGVGMRTERSGSGERNRLGPGSLRIRRPVVRLFAGTYTTCCCALLVSGVVAAVVIVAVVCLLASPEGLWLFNETEVRHFSLRSNIVKCCCRICTANTSGASGEDARRRALKRLVRREPSVTRSIILQLALRPRLATLICA